MNSLLDWANPCFTVNLFIFITDLIITLHLKTRLSDRGLEFTLTVPTE